MNHYFRVKKANPKVSQGFFSTLLSNLNIINWLILVNVLFFILVLLLSAIFGVDFIYDYLALKPNNIFNKLYLWTLLTGMFMHAGFFHLFVNMLSLFFIGNFLEMLIGKKRFFWLYILSGIFAGLFYATLSFYFGDGVITRSIFGHPEIYAVGASGAIFAIAGVLAILTPKNKVYLIAGPLIAIILQAIVSPLVNPALYNIISIIVSIYIFISIFAMISFSKNIRKLALPIKISFWLIPLVAIVPLIVVGLFVELPIGNTAHLGGFLIGALYGVYLRLCYKKKTKAICEYFS